MLRGCQTSQTFLEANMEVSGTPVLVVLLLTVTLSTAQHNQDALKFCVNEIVKAHCASALVDLNIECVVGRDNYDCMRLVQEGKADIVQLEPPEIYTAGHFFNLQVVATKLEKPTDMFRYKTVAVVREGSNINKFEDLKGKKACFPPVKDTELWAMSMGILLNKLKDIDCKNGNELTSIASYFGPSCAPGNWTVDAQVDATLKKENKNLCSFCRTPELCDANQTPQPYDITNCLDHEKGDIAFTTSEEAEENTKLQSDNYHFLCLNDTITSIPFDPTNPCVWAEMPTPGYLAKDEKAIASKINVLVDEVNKLKETSSVPWLEELFGDFYKLSQVSDEKTNWKKYLGSSINAFNRSLNCEKTVKFCTKSDDEQKKCESFKMAAYGRFLRPTIECVKKDSAKDCISAIKERKADIIAVNARDVYATGKHDETQPIVREEYEDNNEYYAVAVVKADSTIKNISDLKGKKSCHTAIGRNAGWIIPLGEFMKLDLMDKKECDMPAAVANYFSESCVPGAKNKEYNPKSSGIDKLCKLCKNPEKCATDDEYAGYEGAFRCLVEVGDVAFVKHTTVLSLTDGNSVLPWAKNLKSSDYKLLCPDGTTAEISEYLKCNLGSAPSYRFVITSSKMDFSDRFNIVYMLTTAGELFKNDSSVFKLFGSYDGKSDLLFKDSTIGLKSVNFSLKYDQVLDADYLESLQLTDPKKCNSATITVAALSMIICSLFLSLAM